MYGGINQRYKAWYYKVCYETLKPGNY